MAIIDSMGKEKTEKLTANERRDLAIEAGLQLIPYVGGSLATLYFGAKEERRFRRIETFYQEVATEVKKTMKSFSISPDDEVSLIAIIEQVNERIEIEQIEEKRRYLKNFLTNIFLQSVGSFDEKSFFLQSLGSMTYLECEVLSGLAVQTAAVPVRGIQKNGVSQYAIVGAVGRLRNLGFIETTITSLQFGGDNAFNESIELSEFGKKFHNFCIMDPE